MRFLALSLALALSLGCAASPAPPAFANSGAQVAAALAAPGRSAKDLERDARDHPEVTLALLGLAPGMRAIDVFSGGGYYAEIAARVVGESGQVLLHNNAAYLGFAGTALTERLAARPFAQITRYDREIEAFDLDGTLDAAVIVMAYHDAYWQPKPEEGSWTVTRDPLMAALFRALRPGGRMLVVDHSAVAGSGSSAAQGLHRIDEAFARADFERAGFRFVAASDVLRSGADDRSTNVFDPAIRGKTDRFVLVFEKPSRELR